MADNDNDDPKLLVRLEANLRAYEKSLKRMDEKMRAATDKVAKSADKSGTEIDRQLSKGARGGEKAVDRMRKNIQRDFQAITRSARGMSGQLNGIMSAIGGAGPASALIGGASLAGLISGVRETTRGFVELEREAAKAGVSVEAFQELQYAGKRIGIDPDAMTDALYEMNLRGAEFVETLGKGPGENAFKALGFSIDEVQAKLANTPAFFEEILTRVSQLKSESQRLFVLDELFGGTGGEQMAALIRAGIDEIRRGRDEAREFGLVVDKELIAKAAELDRKFTRMTTALETWAKTAAVAIGGMMESAAIEVGELAAIVQELESAADQLKEIEEARAKLRRQNLDPVESAEIGLGMRPEVPDNDLVLRDMQRKVADYERGIARTREGIARMEERLEAYNREGDVSNDAIQSLEQRIASSRDRLSEMVAEAERLKNTLNSISGTIHLAPITVGKEYGPNLPPNGQVTPLNSTTANGIKLARISTSEGLAASVNAAVAPQFQAFINELEATGYKIASLGGYNDRNIAGTNVKSKHAYGNAIDINPATNPMGQTLVTDMPANVSDIAARHGLEWGGDWNSKKDAMHFEIPGAASNGPSPTQLAAEAAARDAATQAAQRQAESVARVKDALQFENEQLQRSTLDRQIYDELRRAGVGLDTEEGRQIAALVTKRYEHEEAAKAEAKGVKDATAELKANQEELHQLGQQMGQAFAGAFSGLIMDLAKGKDGVEALKNALTRLADQVLSMALNAAFGKLFGGLFGGLFPAPGLKDGGPVPGFATGGHVRKFATGGFVSGPGGPRSDSIPAMLSNGEFVMNARATKAFGPLLKAINENRVGGFAAGGAIGKMPSLGKSGSGHFGGGGPNINFAPVINVESKSTGDPVADDRAAQQMARAIEGQVRHLVVSEMMQQQRPGGILNRRR